jgi:hypothetical protein
LSLKRLGTTVRANAVRGNRSAENIRGQGFGQISLLDLKSPRAEIVVAVLVSFPLAGQSADRALRKPF